MRSISRRAVPSMRLIDVVHKNTKSDEKRSLASLFITTFFKGVLMHNLNRIRIDNIRENSRRSFIITIKVEGSIKEDVCISGFLIKD